jgi:ubiquinone/menaquinone biosynthesis C-methylase UbiE
VRRSVAHMITDRLGRLSRPMPRSEEMEILDEERHDPDELAANFRDIRRVNAFLGGRAIILRLLPGLIENVPAGRPVTILDIATGCADIPLAVARWAEQCGVQVEITASDYLEDVLELARQSVGDHRAISIARHDARALSLPDDSFDIVLCSLTLHHFPADEAIMILREMDRVSRYGFILNDLRRSRLGYIAAWIASRLTTRNRLTRNDAPLSVKRAFTTDELQQLLREAGIDHATISHHLWFRMAALKRARP